MINAQEGSTINSEDYEIGFNEGYRTGFDWRSQLDNNHKNMLKKYKQSQRALWLARAMMAHTEFAYWCVIAYHCGLQKFNVKHSREQNNVMKLPIEWKNWWFEYEIKCREKAEEYK